MEDENRNREEIFSKAVRAGKRTYFFDVKATRGNDYYLTITESKKRFNDDGTFRYEKHKIFLYKEDFEKFYEGLKEVVDYIQNEQPYTPPPAEEQSSGTVSSDAPEEKKEGSGGDTDPFTDVNFEDLK